MNTDNKKKTFRKYMPDGHLVVYTWNEQRGMYLESETIFFNGKGKKPHETKKASENENQDLKVNRGAEWISEEANMIAVSAPSGWFSNNDMDLQIDRGSLGSISSNNPKTYIWSVPLRISPHIDTYEYSVCEIDESLVPSFLKKIKIMAGLGFKHTMNPLKVFRIKDETGGISFAIAHKTIFTKRDVQIEVLINSAGNCGENIEQVIDRAEVQIADLIYSGKPIIGGDGRQKRCRNLALRIYKGYSNILVPNSKIIVPCFIGKKKDVFRMTFNLAKGKSIPRHIRHLGYKDLLK